MACKKKTVDFEVAMNQPLSRVWIAVVNEGHRLFVAAMPEMYSSIECFGGRWCEKGVTVQFNYTAGFFDFLYSKEKIEERDEDNHFVKWRVVEGGALGKYAREQINSVWYLPGPDANSCIARFSIEYESIGNYNFYEMLKASWTRLLKAVDSYLNANPDYCCVCN